MSGHTSGPWFLEGNWDPKSGWPIGGWVSSFPPAGVPVFELTPSVGTPDEICANARLIAAAPDMFAALKHAQANIPHPDQMIDDAIAKAEGGAS